MKRRKGSAIPLALFAAFAFFLAGFYLGRNMNGEEVRISAEREPSPLAAPEANTEPDAAEEPEPERTEETTQRININTADHETLVTLPGIGNVIAQRIIDYRTRYGDFLSVEALTDVSGIGEKILSQIKPYITVE